MQCGECCKNAFEIHLRKQDVRKWKRLEEEGILQHVKIKISCLAKHKKDAVVPKELLILSRLNNKYEGDQLKEQVNHVIHFVREYHHYRGKDSLPLHVETIIPGVAFDPVFVPKSYDALLKGLDMGLFYTLKFDPYGRCPFLELNSCLIHSIKPIACAEFPFNEDDSLRHVDFLLSKCPGFKKLE